jgi:hypothetical protein
MGSRRPEYKGKDERARPQPPMLIFANAFLASPDSLSAIDARNKGQDVPG